MYLWPWGLPPLVIVHGENIMAFFDFIELIIADYAIMK
jgi:hypothetical protein